MEVEMSNRAELGVSVEKPARGLPWKPIVIILICALAVAAVVLARPWVKQEEENQPPGERPEGYVVFRFTSSFTYVSSTVDGPITDVELRLPWPYVQDSPRTGKPVGLENYVSFGKTDLRIYDWFSKESRRYLMDLFELENVEPDEVYPYSENENVYLYKVNSWHIGMDVWPGVPYTEVGFEPSLKLYYEDQVEWQDNQTIALLGNRTIAPIIAAYFEPQAQTKIFTKITIKLSNMFPGEMVAIEGTFLIVEENAPRVRLDDFIHSEWYKREFNPQQENAPNIDVNWSGPVATTSVISQLEERINGNFILLVKYEEITEDLAAGLHSGFIDDKITR
jgi:hypothetical protein